MKQEITIRVRLSAGQFRRFCAFDSFRIKRRHLPAIIISVVLLTLGIADLLFSKGSSGTLAGLLIGLAIAVPMVVFGLYIIQIETQVRRQGLALTPEVYALRLGEEGVRVTGLNRSAGVISLPWDQMWAAYRAKDAIYLYASEQRAFILPDGQASVSNEQLWAFLQAHLEPGKSFQLR